MIMFGFGESIQAGVGGWIQAEDMDEIVGWVLAGDRGLIGVQRCSVSLLLVFMDE